MAEVCTQTVTCFQVLSLDKVKEDKIYSVIELTPFTLLSTICFASFDINRKVMKCV